MKDHFTLKLSASQLFIQFSFKSQLSRKMNLKNKQSNWI
jgi:hypothetical protein